jgi:hypothetical protein
MTTHETPDETPPPPRWCCRGCRTTGPDPAPPLPCPICRSMQVVDLARPYICPACGATSHNPADAAEGYCGRCHTWTWQRVNKRVLRLGVLAADARFFETADTPMTEPDRLQALIEGAIRHLVGHGLLAVPDDLRERLAALPQSSPYASWGPETREAAPPPASGGRA